MDFWSVLMEIVLLTTTAMALGMVFDRLGQNSISGYIVAGMIVGPGLLNLVGNRILVESLAELGVALLLFSIGLEFSVKRLVSLGRTAVVGGTLQIIFTVLAIALVAHMLGVPTEVSLALGLIAAPSSTAVVIGLLRDRAELDSIHGRHALGILLLQDAALAPMVIMITALGGSGIGMDTFLELSRTTLVAVALFGGLYLVVDLIFPRLVAMMDLARNRELFMLLSAVSCAGATWIAHALGLSPSLGAFAAGVLLAESPFAAQIRSDVSPFRVLFSTTFFCSIGMLADFSWIIDHSLQVVALTGLIVVGKSLIIWIVLSIFKIKPRHALASGVTLGQVGEFSFVMCGLALSQGLLDVSLSRLVISSTILSLFLTPFLVRHACAIGRWSDGFMSRKPRGPILSGSESQEVTLEEHVVVVGFGPAGEEVAKSLREEGMLVAVVDLNPALVQKAQASCRLDEETDYCMTAMVGDATQSEILGHLRIEGSSAVVVTIPDHRSGAEVIRQVRAAAPEVAIFARARLNRFAEELIRAGASEIVDEEAEVGRELGRRVKAAVM